MREFFQHLGFNPIYIFSLVMILFSLSGTKKIKKWEDISLQEKIFAILTWIATLL